ncbi:hypothetical protein B0H63DRAFT_524099 [Podospora didyma]|uniref:Uncharacterized protein n=1 Tax=Podospora didyma TaxID=330526 RepID=A0AAE0NH35_9PEZI|nr:hypothetical protein B0H63DRAFT_524099 [Podospora didyma]
MSSQPLSQDIRNAVIQPIEKAFAGSGALCAASSRSSLSDTYRWAFEESGSKVDYWPWHKQFDTMLDLAYREPKGIVGPLTKGLFDSLDRWCGIRDRVIALCSNIKSTDYNLATGDPVALQSLLSLFADGTKLTLDLREQMETMRAQHDAMLVGVNHWKSTVEALKGSWIVFATEMSKEVGVFDRSKDWFQHLNKWSDIMDMCDNTEELCEKTLDRFYALWACLELLPARLDPILTQ